MSWQGDSKIWYFAYGSNMKASVMKGRSITPYDKVSVVVPTHVLNFDIFGFPYSEPAFASISNRTTTPTDTVFCPDASTQMPSVHGIAYLISLDDYRRLVVSEGGGVAYKEIKLEAMVLGESNGSSPQPGHILVVQTLEAKYSFRPNGAPSQRYLDLLRDGAAEHQLPSSYQEYLRRVGVYTPPASLRTRLGGLIFLAIWRPVLRQIVGYMKQNVDEHGHCEKWIANLIVYCYRAMWASHNLVHARIWGHGDGRH